MTAWHDRKERAALVRTLSLMTVVCPDCATASYRVTWDGTAARWRVVVFHLRSCVCLRHAPSRRACDRWLTDQLTAAGLYVADYCDIVTGLHR